MVCLSEHGAGDICAEPVHSSGDGVDTLHDLTAQATSMYALKSYDAAAELYSRAMELQAEQNGEMAPQNADLLYAYGRCLYHVAVSNSDVLGSKVPGDYPMEASRKPKRKHEEMEMEQDGNRPSEKITVDTSADMVTEKRGMQTAGVDIAAESKPYFQFTGDENFDESEEDDAEDGGEADAGDEEDDFVNAYEVLDLARVLLLRRLNDLQASNGKGSAIEDSEPVKQLKERLADTHDLQAEISLEGERFSNAVLDLRAALALKQELFPQDSSLIAEAHYKLALALEFSSMTQQKEDVEGDGAGKETSVEEAMREEAVKEMEAAIASCRLRIKREEALLQAQIGSNENGDKAQISREGIDDVSEMVKDMEQRLIELRQPPVSLNDPRGAESVDGAVPLNGILGSILGESPSDQKARLEEAFKSANDLTKLVRKKKEPYNARDRDSSTETAPTANGKRKFEFAQDVVEVGTSKKAKIDDGNDQA